MKKDWTENNQLSKNCFYTTFMFWGVYNAKGGANLNKFVLGKRYGFSILNAEHQVSLLKQAAKFLFDLKKYQKQQKHLILFVNEPLNRTFDGIIKFLAFRALQPCRLGKCQNVKLTNEKLRYSMLFFNPKKSNFSVKEANKAGIPIITLNGLDESFLKSLYPIFCNNLQAESIFFISFILTNSIIEGDLFAFSKKIRFKKPTNLL
jgi:ribosomal protein S2